MSKPATETITERNSVLRCGGDVQSAAATVSALNRREVIVSFHNVEKSYDGRVLVVEGLNLDIFRGEFITLLGPSGSGKTTTLMMLAGFEAPTGGEIYLDGRSLAHTPPYNRNMGVVFQNYALFPHLTVARNLAYPLRVRGLKRAEIEAKVARALSMVRLEALGDRKPAQLSGGQQQRVALARALVFEPALVLMDEPLGALDKQLRGQMQIEIKHIQKQLGVTTVYVTHDQSEALAMSDRIAVFNAGRIEQLDTPHNLYEEPSTSFVAQFIGESNRLKGRIVEVRQEHCRVETSEGHLLLARAVGTRTPRSEVVLSIRPERVSFTDGDSSFDNQFGAEILEVVYFGDFSQLRVNALGTDEFILKVPINRIESMLAVGQRLTIGFDAHHCRALEPSG